MNYDIDSFMIGFMTGLRLGRTILMGFIEKTIRANGTYRASDDGVEGYNVVAVSVPNTYEISDEGKVVSSGVLVEQTDLTVSSNGTYDTTRNNRTIVSVSGGDRVYTNGFVPSVEVQIANVSNFTKLYNANLNYGQRGSRVLNNLDLTDENTINSHMGEGWASSNAAYYDSENLIGAYAGYIFNEATFVYKAKFWIGRYSGQNKTLYATVEYMDENGNWHEVKDMAVTTSIPYYSNVYTIIIGQIIYGLRWIHKKEPIKSSSNNIVFFGMTLYTGSGLRPVYVVDGASSGLIEPPDGYTGFGPLLVR